MVNRRIDSIPKPRPSSPGGLILEPTHRFPVGPGPPSYWRARMFLRVDKLQVELPAPLRQDPNAAAALQELLGGKYGEMSTLGNYMFQSFNFRSKSKLRPFYSLVAAITAEELGHVELVSNGVAMLNNGPGDPTEDVD